MKKYYKTLLIFTILYFLSICAFALLTGSSAGISSQRSEDIIKLNDITHDAQDSWNDLSLLKDKDYGIDYAIINNAGEVRLSFPQDSFKHEVSVEWAIKNGCPYLYVVVNDRVQGAVILTDLNRLKWHDTRIRIIIGMCITGFILVIIACFFGEHIRKQIIIPFRNMQDFAGRIAEGKLDEPLAMDRNNMFGAFTESFDIMREELSASKSRELALQKRERELVASLSHDLKTPITGIKVTTELLQAKVKQGDGSSVSYSNSYISEKLDNIYKKADQIDVLVNDLFSSAMEELDELKVYCEDVNASVLNEIIKKYDDKNLVSAGSLPEILIHTDTKRLSQVIGNIITNSYKYAGTKIEVDYKLVDDYLEMTIRDFGPGVPDDEIDLITNKFYRGRQWENSKADGSGLGLYIARMLMEKMDGELIPSSKDKGLTITLMIPLS